jgi:hypothetical protein
VLPFAYDFGRTGKGAKVNLDSLLSNLNLMDDGLDDRPFFLGGEERPSVVEVTGFGQDLVLAEVPDLEEVNLALEPRLLVLDGLESFLKRSVRPAESLRRDLIGHVQLIDPVHVGADLAEVGFKADQSLFLGLDLLVGLAEVPGHVLRREEELSQLLVEDGFEVADTDLIPTGSADVLATFVAGVHVHHAAAVAR